MAAADPAKSPERLKASDREVEASVEEAEAAGSRCSAVPSDEAPAAGRPAKDGGADVGSACVHNASLSEVCGESGAGADKTQERAAAEKMAEAPSGAKRAFDWSEAEEEEEDERAKAVTEECGMLAMLMDFPFSFSRGANLAAASLNYRYLFMDILLTANAANLRLKSAAVCQSHVVDFVLL